MKKIILALLLISTPALADHVSDWALIDRNGTVVWVIVATQKIIDRRTDGPWVRTYYKVGKGWKYNGVNFTPPSLSTYTATAIGLPSSAPVVSTGTVKMNPKKTKAQEQTH
jgi:hypothetical protein